MAVFKRHVGMGNKSRSRGAVCRLESSLLVSVAAIINLKF